jgi:signal peptidase I
MLLALGLVAVVIMTGWVATDAARRQRNWLAWAMLVAFTSVIGLGVWLVARQRIGYAPVRLGLPRGLALFLAAVPLAFLNVAATLFIITFLFQGARVEGQAMAPTLSDKDRVIVNKWAYHTRPPRVGEIVMFYYPLSPDKSFVKRVIAEEGDTIRIIRGRVYRNEVPLDEPFVRPEHRSSENWGPQVIPEGYYFVMGDYRTNSSDSRHWGFVPQKYIVGRIQWRWWPLSAMRSF